ncbi:zinc ribbon domain-containing protein [Hippea jasoniae]|uniref:zinc ribbon domain-containing protein n=1 Tax=Hippea jasoniae TaxID=944479 RepID=UPI000A00EEF8|nr:zinc-ribbon domain and TM2 domain-containing protein [Hippea jasoniae]
MEGQLKATKFCTNCGAEIDAKAEICPKCGVKQPSSNSPAKNPGLAAVLSFLFTGLGQIYNGQIGKGIIFIVMYSISIALMFVVVGFVTTPILWIWGMVDAYKTAERINSGQLKVGPSNKNANI